MLLQEPAYPLEHRISSLMTVGVVKKLKVVEVQHQNTKWCIAALRAFYRSVEGLFQMAPSKQACERTSDGLLTQRIA